MNLIIDKIRDNLTIIDKDNNTFSKGDKIININIDNRFVNISNFKKVVNIVCLISEFTVIESTLFKYLINQLIADDFNYYNTCKFNLNSANINNIAIQTGLSTSSIRRAINGLTIKSVLIQNSDNPNYYYLHNNYDITRFFSDEPIEFITIKL